MEKKQITVLLTHIECVHSTAESGHDDVYFSIYASHNGNETYVESDFLDNPLKMNGKGDDNADINVELGLDLNFVDSLRISIRDKDPNGEYDLIGDAIINRKSSITGTINVDQTTGKGKGYYRLSYRIINKPIQTLRVLGLYCEQDSSGMDDSGVIESVLDAADDCCEAAANVMKKSPRPRAQAISKGFKAASKVLDKLENFADFIANALEGDDDVYMQLTEGGDDSVNGGNFFPPSNSNEKNYKMHKEKRDGNGDPIYTEHNSVFFEDKYGEYFRFPLDDGPVTIQLKDSDHGADDYIGALTIKEEDYNRLKDEGAQVEIAALEWGNDNQGAVYHICYSVGIEDWSKQATEADQGEIT